MDEAHSLPRGEVTFIVKGNRYVFKMGTYALAILERVSKMSSVKFFKRPTEDWGADDMLKVFYAGLYQKHKLSEEQVGDLIDELGSEKVSELILEAVGVANPKEAAAGIADPQMARANGTGTIS